MQVHPIWEAPPGRLACAVLGCRRTCKAPEPAAGVVWQWVCGKHWPAVPKDMRAVLARVRRRFPADSVQVRRIWARCRDRAIIEALQGVNL